MDKYYKIYPVSMNEANVEVTLDTNYNLNHLDVKTLDNLIGVLDLLGFEDKTEEEDDMTYNIEVGTKLKINSSKFVVVKSSQNSFSVQNCRTGFVREVVNKNNKWFYVLRLTQDSFLDFDEEQRKEYQDAKNILDAGADVAEVYREIDIEFDID